MVLFSFMEVFSLYALTFIILLSIYDEQDPYAQKRFEMVEKQIISRGIQNGRVIQAMLKVPRHEFVSESFRDFSYDDRPVPIESGQTVSQPYIVALMTELLAPAPGKKILEVGTGSGYQSAVLAETGCDLYTVEIIEPIALRARKILQNLGYDNIKFNIGDGFSGWEEHAPFDAIIVTAAPGNIPEKLIEQLNPGGRMVIPVGDVNQELKLIEKIDGGTEIRNVTSVRFVPMTGESGRS
jgi:protein-L-isoaspartate(D-aspartate) O-methyltransferase